MGDDIWDEILAAAVDGAKLWITGIIMLLLVAGGIVLWA